MERLDEEILSDLTNRAFKASKFVQVIRKEKYYLETLYLPGYFTNNFPSYSIDELYASCLRLQSKGLIEFAPAAYIKLKTKGANHFSREIKTQNLAVTEMSI